MVIKNSYELYQLIKLSKGVKIRMEGLIKNKTPENTTGESYDRPSYRKYVLFMLMLVYMLNFVDRQLIVILQESIKADLGFSDTQLGIMSGFGFALFYVLFSIPIARLADHGNRRNIIAASLALWSLMTAVCGFTNSFIQMMLARMGVAIGEAGGSPPALSMISDIFPEKRRATAISIFTSGIYFGLILGFVFGGLLGQIYGWRVAFIVIGFPGVLLAIILLLTVKEPLRKENGSSGPALGMAEKQGFIQVLKALWKRKTFRYIALAGGATNFASYSIINWMPSYLLREFDLTMAEVGIWMGLATGLGGIIGTIGGGLLVDRLITFDRRWYVWFPLISIMCALVIGIFMLNSSNPFVAIALGGFSTILFSSWLPSVLAASHGIVNNQTRAQATAVLYFALNIIGMGFGPAAVGLISDSLGMFEGGTSLRIAMMASIIIGVFAANIFFYKSGKTIINDMDSVNSQKTHS